MTFSLTLFHCEKVSCLSLMSVQSLSCVWLFATPWTAAHQASLSIIKSRSLLGDVIQPSYLLSSLSPPVPFSIFPASGSFPMSQFFASGGQSIGVLASILVLPMNIQDWFPLGWTGGSPCSPRDSQESSPTPQFKSINSSVISFLYSPTLTSIHDHWKNHSLDKMNVCWQSTVSAF